MNRSVLFLFALSGLAFAQSTALITGTVVDPSGAAMADAKVICRNVETGLSAPVTTNRAGVFRCSISRSDCTRSLFRRAVLRRSSAAASASSPTRP